MSVQLYAFECGRLSIPSFFLLKGAEGRIEVPIPAYLIVHPKGLALFDSGLSLASRDERDELGAYITPLGAQSKCSSSIPTRWSLEVVTTLLRGSKTS